LGIYLKEYKSTYKRDTCILLFIAALFTIAKIWDQLRCPTTYDWIRKLWYIDTIENYSTIKKNEIMSFFRKIDRTGDHHVK
jgi:hypothetical protein